MQLEEEARADEEGREPDMAKAAEQAEERARRTRSNAICVNVLFHAVLYCMKTRNGSWFI